MAIQTTSVRIAGGTVGWGGLVNREDRMGLIPNEASDCLNVWDDNGVLRKRRGTLSENSFLVKRCEYAATKSGIQLLKNSNVTKIAQEVNLTTGTGGFINGITGSALDITVEVNANLYDGGVATDYVYMELRTKSIGGEPENLIATSATILPSYHPSGENWVSFYFTDVTLTSTNFFIVMTGDTFSSASVGWVYGADVYGSEKAMKYESNAWVEIANVDFNVILNQEFITYTVRGTTKIENYIKLGDLITDVNFETDNQMAWIDGSDYPYEMSNYTGAIMFVEGENRPFEIEAAVDGSPNLHITPSFTSTGGKKQVHIKAVKAISSISGYMVENYFTGVPKALRKTSGVGESIYGEYVSSPFWKRGENPGYVITRKNAGDTGTAPPLIWGTSSYPFTGVPGDMVFTGLTNPITKAESSMWHKNTMFLGGVAINGTNYLDRIYYSGIGTPESGYLDTRYDILDGNITAFLSAGETAFVSTSIKTYILYGDYYENFEYQEHDLSDPVSDQACVCSATIDGKIKFYGISVYGFFEIDFKDKQYIDEKIKEEIKNGDFDNANCWWDKKRNMVLFAIDIDGTQTVFGFDLQNRNWWKFDYDIKQGFWFNISLDRYGHTFGIGATTGYYECDIKNDSAAAINAYYKTAPYYINQGAKFLIYSLWITARNEATTSTLTKDIYKDYTAQQSTVSLRNTNFDNNVPLRHEDSNVNGEANSVEVKLSNNVVDEDFAIQEITVAIQGGQNVDQTL